MNSNAEWKWNFFQGDPGIYTDNVSKYANKKSMEI
jgi:hypothetical protein